MANGMPSMNSAGMGELFTVCACADCAFDLPHRNPYPGAGIDPEQLASLFDQNQGDPRVGERLLGWRAERMSILALGILPTSRPRSSCN
ncbi:MAG: hypothetical protein CM15mP74_17630 [Halieaceae bacterium]|nr:MAG: hypothetical protein CM15mP74_17630 [Halieaceae bacterium]